jgi:hypothetical protein
MSIPFDFSIHKTSQSFVGNGSTKTFAFTDIPVTTKTDIQLLIYNKSTLIQSIIPYDNFTFTSNSSSIGFTVTLDNTINAPTSNEVIIASLVRPVKNDVIFPDGSSPKPAELTIGFQSLCISVATLLLQASQSGISFPIADVSQNIDSLSLPLIDTNIDTFLIGLRKKVNGQYELYYDNSIIENTYNNDIVEISDDYNAINSDNIILFKSNGGVAKNITLYHHLGIKSGCFRYVKIINESVNSVNIKYGNLVIHSLPSMSSCYYKIDASGNYSVVL